MIINLVLLIFGLLFYAIFFYSFHLNNKTPFFITCLVLIIFHDYIFINVSFHATQTVNFVLKAWQEYLFIYLLLLTLINKRNISVQVFYIFVISILLSIFGIGVSLIRSQEVTDTILSWRSYLLPILMPCLIYINRGFHNVSVKSFSVFMVVVLLILVGYAKYQTILFENIGGAKLMFSNKDFRNDAIIVFSESLWFYDFFGTDHIVPRWYNLVREGKLRATSVFVSPIIFAQFLSIISAFLLSYYVKMIRKQRLLVLVLFLISVYGILLSQVRAGLIFLILSFFFIFILRKFRQFYFLLYFVPIFLVVITFLSLILFQVGDSSSLGRLTQYKELFSNLSIIGYGLGDPKSIVNYDSLIISSITAFGVLGIFYFKLHTILIKKIYFIEKFNTHISSSNFIGLALLGCFSGFIYFIFFHYTIGSTPLRFVYFICFFYLYKFYEDDRND